MKLPDEIKRNPEIEVPIEGIRGWKIGGPDGLVVFFEIQPGTVLREPVNEPESEPEKH